MALEEQDELLEEVPGVAGSLEGGEYSPQEEGWVGHWSRGGSICLPSLWLQEWPPRMPRPRDMPPPPQLLLLSLPPWRVCCPR